jgi:hypothetical protein
MLIELMSASAAACSDRFLSFQSAIQVLTVATVSRSRSRSDLSGRVVHSSARAFTAPAFIILIRVCIVINSYC